MVHMCVTKQRNASKNEKDVRMAFNIWLRFYQLTCKTQTKTWDDFIRSKYYNSFMKVGKYITELNAVNTALFIDFLINSALPVDKWTNKSVYETYIRELSKKETPDAAVERSIALMQAWAATTGEEWNTFFRNVAPTQATMWINSGRLSPWVLYIANGGLDLLDRLSPEQLKLVGPVIDPSFWSIKMDRHADDVVYLRTVLDGAGL